MQAHLVHLALAGKGGHWIDGVYQKRLKINCKGTQRIAHSITSIMNPRLINYLIHKYDRSAQSRITT